MSFVAQLMDTAVADTDLLKSLDEKGDDFRIARDVDFLLRARDKAKAELVCNFINEYSYGNASVQEAGGAYCVTVVIHMPVTQHVVLSVSGFIATLCHLYELEYDGWGCIAQTAR